MRAAELVVTLGPDVPREFQDPVSHSGWWLVLALVALALVAAYYLVVTVLTRPPRLALEPEPVADAPRPDVQGDALAQIERIAHAVNTGEISARTGHQRISRTVRGYVAQVSRLPADRMILADLRAAIRHERRAAGLAEAVAVMYPPAFAPDEEGQAADRFPDAVRRAREVVTTWT